MSTLSEKLRIAALSAVTLAGPACVAPYSEPVKTIPADWTNPDLKKPAPTKPKSGAEELKVRSAQANPYATLKTPA